MPIPWESRPTSLRRRTRFYRLAAACAMAICASAANAQVQLDFTQPASTASSGNTLNRTHFVPLGTNCRVLVIAVSGWNGTQVASATWNVPGQPVQTATRVRHQPNGSQPACWTELLAILSPNMGNGTITVTTSANFTSLAVGAFSFSNARQQMPAPTGGAAGNTNDTLHVTLNVAAGSYTVCAAMGEKTDSWDVQNSSLTEVWDVAINSRRAAGGYRFCATAGNHTMSYRMDDNDSRKVLVGAAIQPAGTPGISLVGTSPMFHQCGTPFTDPGATATDGFGNNITNCCINITYGVNGPPNPNVPGDYTINYTVACGSGASASRLVQVRDTIPPVITVVGIPSNELQIECRVPFDLNSIVPSAVDSCDTNLPPIQTNYGVPFFNPFAPTVGDYTITYQVQDASGNPGINTFDVFVRDTLGPDIVVAPDTVLLDCETFDMTDALQGVTVSDVCEVDYDDGVIISGDALPFTLPGNYTLFYDAFDSQGNPAVQRQRLVAIVDSDDPVITNTVPSATVVCPDTYTEAEAREFVTASDPCAGDLTANIVVTAERQSDNAPVSFPLTDLGAYIIRYNVDDFGGNSAAELTRSVEVVNTNPLQWTIPGDLIVSSGDLPLDEAVALTGVSASDPCENHAVSVELQDFDGTPLALPLNDPGAPYPRVYRLSYSALDGQGVLQTDATRLVVVFGGAPAGIAVLGANPLTVECRAPYGPDEDAGAVAYDPGFGDITGQIIVTGLPVDTAQIGSHFVTYSVTAGLTTYEAQREVIVEDTQPPALTLVGALILQTPTGVPFEDPGATALDDCEGDLSDDVVIGGDTVNTNAPAATQYNVTYNVADSSGNPAAPLGRIVILVDDDTPPVLILDGLTGIEVGCGEGFAEPGYSAADDFDGDLTPEVIVSGAPGIFSPPGVYTVTYTVSDRSGNIAQDSRTVTVRNDCPLRVEYIGELDPGGGYVKTIMSGGSYTFAVLVIDAIGTPVHNWLKAADAKAFVPISGAPDSPSFTLHDLSSEDSGVYLCVVNDAVTTAQSPEITFIVETGIPAANVFGLAALALAIAAAGAAAVRGARRASWEHRS